MPLLNASIDILLYTLIAIGVPLIVRTISLQKPQPTSRPFLRTPLSILVVLHTLFTLYTLVWHQPPNLFTALDIPITTPAQRIRSAIFEHTARDPRFIISPSHDALLARLSSFEVRTFLVRFGQQAVESCEYCQSLNDFAIHSIPRPLLEYVREAFLIGLVTTHGSARERRRMFAVALLACAAADACNSRTSLCWITMHSGTTFSGRCDTSFSLESSRPSISFRRSLHRHEFVRLSPSLRRSSTPHSHVPNSCAIPVERSSATQDLRARAAAFWEDDKRVGNWIREDKGVRKAAAETGLWIDEGFAGVKGAERREGQLKTAAVMAASTLREWLNASTDLDAVNDGLRT
ncbi:hypothetical protein EW146_g2201 [Bondarzewia mesenterica]|uniref:Uncharacterized protein n=1 Tax=Bondarzewia mesenterica TaxID=1095465 RepID=A0A4S4M1K1_9AGAM|nr:hypothetical protein EW146_g2201 [Bondarzewia mesenterica]